MLSRWTPEGSNLALEPQQGFPEEETAVARLRVGGLQMGKTAPYTNGTA